MFNIDMEQELENFDRDRNRFKNLKKMMDFKLGAEEFDGKSIEMKSPKYKKKLKRSKYIKPHNRDKSLF